jgi:hypothetical protein
MTEGPPRASESTGRPFCISQTPQYVTTAMVEMGGIEPPSIAVIPRLLRAHLVKAFYSAPTFATSI